MSEINKNDSGSLILHSKKIHASYGATEIVTHLLDMTLVGIIIFFYEAEVGLNIWLITLAYTIYLIWDAFNDPLVGYLTDRPFKFTEKWGRRFPWMMISYIPWLISFILIFAPPSIGDQWILFFWLVATLCLYDFLESLFTVNFFALYPDKFRDKDERVSVSMFIVYLGFFGIIGAFIIPPFIIRFGDIGSYTLMAVVCVAISLVCFIFMIPGLRDDKECVENYLAKCGEAEKESFFKVLKEALKQKSFVVFLIMFVCYQALTNLMTGSLFYFVRYVLEGEAIITAILMLSMLIGGAISVPFWMRYNRKTGDTRKVMLVGGIMMVFFAAILSAFTNLIVVIIFVLLWGMGLGGYWVMYRVIFGEVIDESIVINEKRREGTYNGVRIFFSRAAGVIQVVTIAVVHQLTGFSSGASTQSDLALIGIRLHMGLIPAIFMGIGLLVFWKFYDITPSKAQKFKEEILRLKL
ncbi:MAG: MFS transporter [Promethearchaeota archaeon]|nr:MAG: MFS transporter [Candidatus Lokiarchaeota archaeon]